jgi:hypothetical protein
MKKIGLVLFLMVSITLLYAETWEQAVQNAAKAIAKNVPQGREVRVVGFTGNTEYSRIIPMRLRSRLSAERVTVLSDANDELIAEALAQADELLSNQKKITNIETYGAQYLVIGSLIGANFHVEAVDVTGGIMLASYDSVLHYETTGTKLTRGALNLVVGFGSFISGDWVGGVTIATGYTLAAGLIVYEFTALHKGDSLANIPGNVGFGLAGITAVYGILRPFLLDKVLLKKELSAANPIEHIKLAITPDNKIALVYSFSY